MTLDNVSLMGRTDSAYGQNGFSQFGERHGSSSSDTWDATIGVMAHELGHAYFDLPDLYDTSAIGEGIGAFGLMGGGSWGKKSSSEKSGATPVHLSAWSKENISACVPQTVDNVVQTISPCRQFIKAVFMLLLVESTKPQLRKVMNISSLKTVVQEGMMKDSIIKSCGVIQVMSRVVSPILLEEWRSGMSRIYSVPVLR